MIYYQILMKKVFCAKSLNIFFKTRCQFISPLSTSSLEVTVVLCRLLINISRIIKWHCGILSVYLLYSFVLASQM